MPLFPSVCYFLYPFRTIFCFCFCSILFTSFSLNCFYFHPFQFFMSASYFVPFSVFILSLWDILYLSLNFSLFSVWFLLLCLFSMNLFCLFESFYLILLCNLYLPFWDLLFWSFKLHHFNASKQMQLSKQTYKIGNFDCEIDFAMLHIILNVKCPFEYTFWAPFVIFSPMIIYTIKDQ